MLYKLNVRLGDALSYVYAVIAVLTVGEVGARYLFHSPTQWTVEVVLFLAALHYMLSGGQSYALGNHIRITVLYDRLPKRIQYYLTLMERVVVAAVCAATGYWAVHQARVALSVMERSGSSWNLPTPTVLKIVLVIAFALFGLQAVRYFIRDLRRPHGS